MAGAEGDGKSRRSEVRKETTKGHSPDTLQRCSVHNQVYCMHMCNSHKRLCTVHLILCPIFFLFNYITLKIHPTFFFIALGT